MGRIVEPLRADGRQASPAGPAATLLPLAITGRADLTPITYDDAGPQRPGQVGDPARGPRRPTARRAVTEAVATRDHTERMLRARGVAVDEGDRPRRRGTRCASPGPHGRGRDRRDGARPIRRPPRSGWWPASIHPDAELRLDGVSTNPTRRAIIDILRRMGADIEEHDRPAPGGADGEPLADLVVRSSELRGVDLSPAEVAAAIDEIPILALAAAVADRHHPVPRRGRAPAQGVRPDRRDRGRARAPSAREVRVEGDDIEIHGGRPPGGRGHRDPRRSPARDDVRDRGPLAEGETIVRRPGSAAISYPGFFAANSKGCGHDEARRPHRPSGGPFAVRRDAAGRLRPRRHRRHVRAVGPRADRPRRRDRGAADRRLPRRQRHDPAQGAGRAAWSTG